jgi:adenylate kinase family enzyme
MSNIKSEKPFCIIISGLPSSGKTHLAIKLSKGLGIYLLNSDFVRAKFCDSMQDHFDNVVLSTMNAVNQENKERCTILCASRTSFIFDGNGLDYDVYARLLQLLDHFDYERINIRIKSSEAKCEENYSKRKIGGMFNDLDVIGDNVFFTPALPWKTGNQDVSDNNFQHIIENYGSIEEYNNNIKELIEQIKNARSKQNER